VTASAGRAIQHNLPEGIAAAVVEFITGTLLENPHRVGNALRRELTKIYSARRGAFRIVYEIDDDSRLVTVFRVEHRADVYRPRLKVIPNLHTQTDHRRHRFGPATCEHDAGQEPVG
jgi:mRNA-degrading endonuclease RelE of RelBE toxin-antitoxin system